MNTSRDQIFCKIAIQQGLWSEAEATLFLNQYISEGSPGRFGDWASQQGAVPPAMATRIDAAIEKKMGPPKPRPSTASQGSTSGRKANKGRSSRRKRKGSGGLGIDFEKNPVQTSIYLSCAVIVIGMVFYVVYQFQKTDPVRESVVTQESPEDKAKKEAQAKAAAEVLAAQKPDFSEEELRGMDNVINQAVADARQFLRDGKLAKGIQRLETVRNDLGGDDLPEAQKTRIDGQITELNQIRVDTYNDLLSEYREALSNSNSEDAADLLDEIEMNCGSEFRARAEKEGA